MLALFRGGSIALAKGPKAYGRICRTKAVDGARVLKEVLMELEAHGWERGGCGKQPAHHSALAGAKSDSGPACLQQVFSFPPSPFV